MLNLGDRYTITVESTNIFANGVCRIDGFVVFIEGAIAGEVCEIIITKLYPRYAYAKCVKIVEESPHRIVPSCICFSECGGCLFSHITQEFENQIKFDYVKSTFAKQKIDAEFEKTLTPVSQNYRNKVVLFFDGTSFGYMARSSNKTVPHKQCQLNEDVFDQIASFTAEALASSSLRALYLRKTWGSEPQIMVCPIFFEQTDVYSYAAQLVEKFPCVRTVLYSIYKEKNFVLENAKFKVVYGDGYVFDTLCGLKFRVSPESFYQVNHVCAEQLYEKAIEYASLDCNSVCADLFCGTGTIGIIAAHKTGATVYGVEIVERAIADAKYNARQNGIKNAHFEAMDAGKFDKSIDTCIIDPPRKGCSEQMLTTLKRLKPKKIVYVSCNVDTMVRDIKALLEEYEISDPVSIFNLFPRTNHVESVVCLSRK